jgi:hypothetical protein
MRVCIDQTRQNHAPSRIDFTVGAISTAYFASPPYRYDAPVVDGYSTVGD